MNFMMSDKTGATTPYRNQINRTMHGNKFDNDDPWRKAINNYTLGGEQQSRSNPRPPKSQRNSQTGLNSGKGTERHHARIIKITDVGAAGLGSGRSAKVMKNQGRSRLSATSLKQSQPKSNQSANAQGHPLKDQKNANYELKFPNSLIKVSQLE